MRVMMVRPSLLKTPTLVNFAREVKRIDEKEEIRRNTVTSEREFHKIDFFSVFDLLT